MHGLSYRYYKIYFHPLENITLFWKYKKSTSRFSDLSRKLTKSNKSDPPNPIQPIILHHLNDWRVNFIFKNIWNFGKLKLWSLDWPSQKSHLSESFYFEGNVIINSYSMDHLCRQPPLFKMICIYCSASLDQLNCH